MSPHGQRAAHLLAGLPPPAPQHAASDDEWLPQVLLLTFTLTLIMMCAAAWWGVVALARAIARRQVILLERESRLERMREEELDAKRSRTVRAERLGSALFGGNKAPPPHK